MILADTAIWVDHLHHFDDDLAQLIANDQLIMHPFIIGEVALGSLRDRLTLIERLQLLPAAPIARNEIVLTLIETAMLFSTGVGYVDAHLLASVRLLPGAALWTRDKRLLAHAGRLGIAYQP